MDIINTINNITNNSHNSKTIDEENKDNFNIKVYNSVKPIKILKLKTGNLMKRILSKSPENKNENSKKIKVSNSPLAKDSLVNNSNNSNKAKNMIIIPKIKNNIIPMKTFMTNMSPNYKKEILARLKSNSPKFNNINYLKNNVSPPKINTLIFMKDSKPHMNIQSKSQEKDKTNFILEDILKKKKVLII